MQMDTDCRPKQNGNTPAGRAPPRPISSETILQNLVITRGSTRIQGDIHGQSARSSPTPGAFTISVAMSGNGAMTSTKWIITRKPLAKIHVGRPKVKPKWFAAGRGDLARKAAAPAIVT